MRVGLLGGGGGEGGAGKFKEGEVFRFIGFVAGFFII